MKLRYTVNADHVSPRYRLVRHEAIAKPSPGQEGFWFATSDFLGCSEDYSSPDAAVRSLFETNGNTRIRLHDAGMANESSLECPHCHWGFAPTALAQHIREKH
jgi:hypothetical protein